MPHPLYHSPVGQAASRAWRATWTTKSSNEKQWRPISTDVNMANMSWMDKSPTWKNTSQLFLSPAYAISTLIHHGLVPYISFKKNSSHFPSDARMCCNSLHDFSYSPRVKYKRHPIAHSSRNKFQWNWNKKICNWIWTLSSKMAVIHPSPSDLGGNSRWGHSGARTKVNKA